MKLNICKINKSKMNKIILLSLIFMLFVAVKSYAGSFSISTTPATAEPNSAVTISITGSNATGRINLSGSNISLSGSSVWVENNTQTITGTLTGGDGQTATITATAADLVDSTTADDIKGSKSASVTIKKKEVVEQKPAETVQQTQPAQQAQPAKPVQQNQNVQKKENKPVQKQEVPKENNIEDQGTVAEFGINSLFIFGVNENGEKVEIKYTPEFNINTAEYTCNVEENIKKIELDYDASEYKDLVKIDGLDKDLQGGENVINLNMKKDDGTEKNYKITIIKPVTEAVEENAVAGAVLGNSGNNSSTDNKSGLGNINIPVSTFVALQIGIIIIEGIIFTFVHCIMDNRKKIRLAKIRKARYEAVK